jgi:SAM-dependent methyltransferase
MAFCAAGLFGWALSILMSYTKRFSVILIVCMSAAILGINYYLLRRFPLPVSNSFLFFGFLAVAAASRISGTLAAQFARLCGRAMFISPLRTLVGLFLQKNIELIPTTETPDGMQDVSYEEFAYEQVVHKWKDQGLKLHVLCANMGSFQSYLEAARYEEYYPDYYRGASKYLLHKQIQHYLSTVITPIQGSEVWMDVASSSSPFPDILTRLYGIDVYRQDLAYPPGIRGLYIGSNAAAIPLPDESIDRISLHCSFEHFEKDSDSAFVCELARLLRPGGVACIIPLYLSNTYQILTNPRYWLSRGVPGEEGTQVTISHTYWESHGRFYDAKALERRVIQPLREAKLNYRLIQVQVPPEIDYSPFMVLEISKP